ncbi:unnamed protein product [Heligmosomoides polygyrus]|uniref:Secreted protein n=1 Tax=Heligmosomoides polygyrus TaxID=6339 RepID=A0A183FEB1_HELPZ|nr:unnamed protein product [Heligmosomoides polygyrus]
MSIFVAPLAGCATGISTLAARGPRRLLFATGLSLSRKRCEIFSRCFHSTLRPSVSADVGDDAAVPVKDVHIAKRGPHSVRLPH